MPWRCDSTFLPQDLTSFPARLLNRRSGCFLHLQDYISTPPLALPGVMEAVDRIQRAKERQEKVMIYGDFDAGGVVATAILLCTLQTIGIEADFVFPHRTQEGHGLHLHRVNALAQAGVSLIITADCGIDDRQAIAQLQVQGIDVIVIDHHGLPQELPSCTAVIHPLRVADPHPLRTLRGVGVAYKLAEALWSGAPSLLDLVAIGVTAEAGVPLDENRYLLLCGLEALACSDRVGLKALLGGRQRFLGRELRTGLAPLLRGLAHLEDASLAVELLLAPNLDRAQILGEELKTLQSHQQTLSQDCLRQAIAFAPEVDCPRALVLQHPECQPGILGIVAWELHQSYRCPVVLMTESGYGVAQSGEGIDLVQVFAQLGPLLQQWWGHGRSGQFSIAPENADRVIHRLQQLLHGAVGSDRHQELLIEALIPYTKHLSTRELQEIYDRVSQLEPFGEQNPSPILALTQVPIENNNPFLDNSGNNLLFNVRGKIFYWKDREEKLAQIRRWKRVDIAFQLETEEKHGWRGQIVAVRRSMRQAAQPPCQTSLQVIDWRTQSQYPVGAIPYSPDLQMLLSEQPLYLLCIPYGVEHLRQILHQLRPTIMYLGGNSTPELTANWEQNIVLFPLIHRQWLSHESYAHDPNNALQQIIEEHRSFQQWFQAAPIEAISRLCQRLC